MSVGCKLKFYFVVSLNFNSTFPLCLILGLTLQGGLGGSKVAASHVLSCTSHHSAKGVILYPTVHVYVIAVYLKLYNHIILY